MKKKRKLSLVLLVLAGALLSFRPYEEVDWMDNQTFVNKAPASNLFEIEAGKLADTKAKSNDVKDLGQKWLRTIPKWVKK